MQLPQIAPLTVQAVVRALAELGIEHDPLSMRSVTIDHNGLTLEVLGNEAGEVQRFGNEVLTHTIRVPWDTAILAAHDG